MLRPGSPALAGLLIVLIALGPLSTDMYLPSLPLMAVALGADVAAVQLTLSVFLGGFALAMLAYGPLSDRYGRRPVVIGGIAIYLVATVACALAPTIETLIAARLAQAVGACVGPVLGRAVVRDMWDRDGAVRVLAYMSAAMALAPLVAPILGGWLAAAFGWRMVFVAMLGAAVLVLAAVVAGLPETNTRRNPEAVRPGRMLRTYLGILGSRAFRGYMLTAAPVFGGMFAFISGSSFVLIEVLGVPVENFGFGFAPVVAGYMVGSTIAGRLARRVAVETMVGWGSLLCLLGGATLAGLALAGVERLAAVLVPMFVYLVGMGLALPSAQAGAVHPFPDRAGAASALLGFVQMAFSAAAGVAVGQWHDGTTVPMAVVIGGLGTASFAAWALAVRSRPAA